MKLKKNYEISLFVVGCILINYIGRVLTELLVLPFWLDSVGTVFTAYVLGPVCGAVVGVTGNILYGLHVRTVLFYGLVNIMVGVTVGLCAKKGFLQNTFGMLSTAFLVAVFSTAISTPLNMVLAEGSTGNVWGDGVAELLQELGCNRTLSCIAGEFYLDFLDKSIAMLLLFLAVHLFRRKKGGGGKRQKNRKTLSGIFLGILLVYAVFTPANIVRAAETPDDRKAEADDFHKYVQTIYNEKNGLTGGIASDVAQTKDGVLWIGTYGGLYRYSGSTFQRMQELESVKTVNCLYTDEAGRLWIGTNDNGLSICINQRISNVVNRENGLPSNSVHSITENTEGYYYVGTTDGLVIMTLSSGLKVCGTIQELAYADSICADRDGNVAAVTQEGGLYLLRGTEIVSRQIPQGKERTYSCCVFDETGNLYAGTSANTIEVYQVANGQLKKVSSMECGGFGDIHSLYFSEEGVLFVCAENGVGYINAENCFCPIGISNFNSSIEHMLMDYQGNLWFTSSRLGLLRLCPSVFSEVYGGEGLSENVVNAITGWRGCLYFGTDSGLEVMNGKREVQTPDTVTEAFDGVRVRCLMVDSQNHLWAGTSGRGIWEVSENGELKKYDNTAGTSGEKFRSVIETKDGVIAAAGDSGITFIKDGAVCGTVGTAEGLGNPVVISLCEREDGSIWAGTDGSGIAVIKDGKVTETLKQENGLSSEAVARMIPDSDGGGLFIVTGNGLCYADDGGNIRILDNFPYYNNYDLVEGNQGELFVLSSAGIYIVDKAELLAGAELKYELLDSRKGLRVNLTPNSWNYLDEEDNLYLAGNTGVASFNLNQYNITVRSYRMLLTRMEIDGEVYPIEKGEAIRIPRGADRIEIAPEVVNYSVNDPDIRICLEGFDRKPKTIPQSELTSVVYTNLPSGEYTFRLAVLDSRTGGVIAENTYRIIKEKEIYDNWWFRLYAGIVGIVIISYLTWLFFRTQIQKTLRMQKMELEWAKSQLQMGNETILTIAQAVDAKDERTSQHSVRVSEYSVMIARRLGFGEEACEELRKMAMLHDIGKIGIPDCVLNKPARLTDEEYEIMKSHVERGAEILKNFTLIDHVAEGALYHHERYDGKGYVHGLKGEEIPLNARIIGIADAFDAMTANRVYRKKLELENVLEELKKGSGAQFDPKLVEIMLGLIQDGTIDVKQIYQSVSGEDGKVERVYEDRNETSL